MNFREISQRHTVVLECSVCGLDRKRIIKAFQTLNPYNTNADGSVKSISDIHRELPAELDRLERDLRAKEFVCIPCKRDGIAEALADAGISP